MNEINVAKELPASVAGWLEEYKKIKSQIKELEERANIARAHVEEFLEDVDLGTVNGKPVIKWIYVEQGRFDQAEAKKILTAEQIQACTKIVTTRQFRPVNEDDL